MRMRYFPALVVLALLVLAGCEPGEVPTAADDPADLAASLAAKGVSNGDVIPGQYIVVLRDDIDASRVPGVAADLARQHAATVGFHYQHALKGFSAHLSEQAAANLARNANVKSVEPDRVVDIGPLKGKPGGGGGTPPPQTTPWGIARVNGGVQYAGSGVAWVIDTGIDLDHPDLNVDASRGFSAFTRGKDASLDDGHGHGTHVSGTIAALNNGIGVIGVAAGATVIPVKVLSSAGSGSTSGVIAGVDHVAANSNNGDVANMSLGGGVSQALDGAVVNASNTGVKFALAAGNESDHANNHSPARANGANIVTVCAISQGDVWVSFSNYGKPPVDYCAPGVSVLSSWKGGGYNTISGTSMATPHVAGILLLGNIRNGGTVTRVGGDDYPIAVH